ncbi:MAG: hypothetical protein H0T47_06155 [Planctomycetaceae bacterium]|nr:hypothetical protein [Planctomycetaceae bacterium]
MKLFLSIAAALGLALAVWFGWLLNDLRLELKRSAQTVNRDLPVILANTRKSTETLAEVSGDIKELRNLAGVDDAPRDQTLVTYADSVLDLIETQADAKIGTEKLIGKSLSDPVPAKEWVAGARKEAVWLTFRAKSRTELLDRLVRTKFGSDWKIQFGDAQPQSLREWLVENHPPTAESAQQPARDETP